MLSATIAVDIESGRIIRAEDEYRMLWNGSGPEWQSLEDVLTLDSGDGELTEYLSRFAEEQDLSPLILRHREDANLFKVFISYPEMPSSGEKGGLLLHLYPVSTRSEPLSGTHITPPRETFDAITDFMLICSADYTIRQANQAAEAVFGTSQQVVGKKCYTVLRGKTKPCEDCPLPSTLRKNKVIPLEYYDAEIGEFLEVRTYPIADDQELYDGFTIVNRVVSFRREKDSEMTQAKKLEALGRMASGIAHDFNNILSIITGYLEMLKLKPEKVSLSRAIDLMSGAASDGITMIQRLQDFTRQPGDVKPGNAGTLQVVSFINAVVEFAQTRIRQVLEEQGYRIAVDVQIDPGIKIIGDEAMLRSAFLNLVINAIEAMTMGGVVSIWSMTEGDAVAICIADTGRGMTKKVMDQIFDPFFTTKGSRGNGMGLAEVYGIINQHQGSIEVESKPGEGTTFKIRLPGAADEK